ncbi:MAG: exodeoxyribonuclease VII large subunit [Peptoniphilus sp.]|nr:exodeoxyribonuclease VII large subunit [Peptoniphilus sp.]MDY3119242.1 exodeoxyribonuclease VII large subunit [Peptoniphilus sp.]
MNPISVSELLAYTKKVLRTDYLLNQVLMKGELAEIKEARSGHIYFTVKDASARMDCVMFKEDAKTCDDDFQVGMEVEVNGSVAIHAPSGRLQFVAKTMELTGEGALYKLFLKLKDLLTKEGLFDMDKKMPLPECPVTVGIVTSAAGAALHDFLQVAAERNPAVSVILSPTIVQGDGAGASIARAFKRLDEREDVDVILVTRGGGSMEDLFCFNDEVLIRTLAKRRHPLVSAVGHEVDTTLCDYVADVRAATPTHGAEIIVPRGDDMISEARWRLRLAERALSMEIQEVQQKVGGYYHRLKQTMSMDAIANRNFVLQAKKVRMDFQLKQALSLRRQQLRTLASRIEAVDLYACRDRESFDLSSKKKRMERSVDQSMKSARRELTILGGHVRALGRERAKPRVCLGASTIRSVGDVAIGDTLSVEFLDGRIDARILSVERNGHEL